MPTFENIEVELTETISVDFEVFCGTCGDGLCNESDVRKSRGRGYLQVTVNACPDCMKAKDDEIKNLQSIIDELENKLSQLSE